KLREGVLAACDAHQLGHPLDAGDQRLVPFLEVDARPYAPRLRAFARRIQAALQFARPCIGLGRHADQRAQAADVVEDAVHAAVVGDPHLHATAHQFGGDIGLDVGEADRKIRPERQDRLDLGTGERADLGLLAPGLRRAHGEAADADDAVLFAEGVKRLRRLLGEADDAARAHQPTRLRKYTTRSVSAKPQARCAAWLAVLSSRASAASSVQPRPRVHPSTARSRARPTPRPRQPGATYQASRKPTGELAVPLT